MDKPKVKNDKGQRLTLGLFYETTLEDKSSVVYTLKDQDHLGYPSLYRLYMEMEDITEFAFANAYLDGYEHWTRICATKWFEPYITRWREELRLKLENRHLELLKAQATLPGKDGLAANKELLKRLEKAKEPVKRGRPIKDTSLLDSAALRASQAEVEDDYSRLNNTEGTA